MTRVFVVFALLRFAACIGCARQVPAAVPTQERPAFIEASVSMKPAPCVDPAKDDQGGVKEIGADDIDGILWNPAMPPEEAFFILKKTCDGFSASHLLVDGGQAAELIIKFAFGGRPWLGGPFLGRDEWLVLILQKETSETGAEWAGRQ